MSRRKAKNPELIVLWGSKTHELTVGITRSVGWEVVGKASSDGMFARQDCSDDWALRLGSVFVTLRDNPKRQMIRYATPCKAFRLLRV